MTNEPDITKQTLSSLLKSGKRVFYTYLPIWSCLAFLVGLLLPRIIPALAIATANLMSGLIDAYSFLAPFAIFFVLAPSLTKLLSMQANNGTKFVGHAILWFMKLRLSACLLAIIFTAVVFDLPLYVNGSVALKGAILNTLKIQGDMFLNSPYFYAVYASLIATVIARKIPKVQWCLFSCANSVEWLGEKLMPFIPLFMLVIGVYIYQLPDILQSQINTGGGVRDLVSCNILGITFNTESSTQIFAVYCLGAFLTGVACIAWHVGLLAVVKWKIDGFSIRGYLRNYWVKMYPLLWATSSEALATPLNLHLTAKCYPNVKPEIRRFAVGSGSFLSINGTMICVFIMAGIVTKLVGVEISVLHLLLSLPFIFVLGYSVPGIPGELILFAGPLAQLLGLPPSMTPIFILLYVSLQVGLPDSFRTGANSTDNCLSCLLLNQTYEKRYMGSTIPKRPKQENVTDLSYSIERR